MLNLEKAQDIPEAIGAAQVCVTLSNPFAIAFEISPSVGRPPNGSAPAIGNKSYMPMIINAFLFLLLYLFN